MNGSWSEEGNQMDVGASEGRGGAPPRPDPAGPGQRVYGYRRLTRPLGRKVVAGVCAGLGDYFDVDPVLFRVAFVVLTLFGGVGVIAYGVAWWIIPAGDEAVPAAMPRGERVMRRLKGAPTWVGVALLVVGAALLIGQIGVWRPGVVWGITLIALGMLLFRQSAGRGARVREEEATAPPGAAFVTEQAVAAVAEAPSAAPAQRARRTRQRSPLGWITFGVALVAVGVAAVLDSAGVVHPSLAQYFALPLAVLGIGLLVGTAWGRSRWLIVPGILLVPFVLAASLVDVPLTGGVGERVDRPASVVQVQGAYHLAAGQQILDLRQVPANGKLLRITMTVGAGSLVVLVPPSADVTVRGRVGGGEVELFGRIFDGLRMDVRRSSHPASPSGERVILDLAAGYGQVKVSNDPNDVAGLDQGGA